MEKMGRWGVLRAPQQPKGRPRQPRHAAEVEREREVERHSNNRETQRSEGKRNSHVRRLAGPLLARPVDLVGAILKETFAAGHVSGECPL